MPECAECDLPIEGDAVWYRPFAGMAPAEEGVGDMIGTASYEPSESALPFHPACFTNRTGLEPPPR